MARFSDPYTSCKCKRMARCTLSTSCRWLSWPLGARMSSATSTALAVLALMTLGSRHTWGTCACVCKGCLVANVVDWGAVVAMCALGDGVVPVAATAAVCLRCAGKSASRDAKSAAILAFCALMTTSGPLSLLYSNEGLARTAAPAAGVLLLSGGRGRCCFFFLLCGRFLDQRWCCFLPPTCLLPLPVRARVRRSCCLAWDSMAARNFTFLAWCTNAAVLVPTGAAALFADACGRRCGCGQD